MAAAAAESSGQDQVLERGAAAGAAAPVVFFPEQRERAIVTVGQEECSKKMRELYEHMGLPKGLLPLQDIVEGGWCEETGFTWVVTARPQRHHFERADKLCAYDQVVTSTVSKGRVSHIRGVRARELGLWVPVNEIFVAAADSKLPDRGPKKLVFKSIMGFSRSMPFELYD
jgi:hypothetical protein